MTAWNLSDKIAAIAIIVGFLQFVVLLATVGVMAFTARRQLRAYLAVRPIQATNVYPQLVPRIDFEIVNTGQTPAYNVRYVAIAEVLEHPLLDHQGTLALPLPRQRMPTQPVHSSMKISGEAIADRAISLDEWVQMTDKDTHRFYLAGMVFYEDIFGRERFTKFCAFVGGRTFGLTAIAAFKREEPIVAAATEWTFSQVHNEAS